MWEGSIRLSRSEAVAAGLGIIQLLPEAYDSVHSLLFANQLAFVVAHEYTHHVHGHLLKRRPAPAFLNEILDAPEDGNLELQAHEVDADAYSAYYVLADLIDGGLRQQAVGLLRLEEQNEGVQDEVLLSSFVIAVGAFLFARTPSTVDNTRIYKLIHPPQAARMNFIMHSAFTWCEQNRPHLNAYMTPEKFQMLMRATAMATWGMNGGTDWAVQTAFLQSDEGARYISKLDERFKAHVRSLGASR